MNDNQENLQTCNECKQVSNDNGINDVRHNETFETILKDSMNNAADILPHLRYVFCMAFTAANHSNPNIDLIVWCLNKIKESNDRYKQSIGCLVQNIYFYLAETSVTVSDFARVWDVDVERGPYPLPYYMIGAGRLDILKWLLVERKQPVGVYVEAEKLFLAICNCYNGKVGSVEMFKYILLERPTGRMKKADVFAALKLSEHPICDSTQPTCFDMLQFVLFDIKMLDRDQIFSFWVDIVGKNATTYDSRGQWIKWFLQKQQNMFTVEEFMKATPIEHKQQVEGIIQQFEAMK